MGEGVGVLVSAAKLPQERPMTQLSFASAFAALGIALLAAPVVAQSPEHKKTQAPEKSNMELVGWSDLQGRSAYQPLVHKQGDRFIAYIGHHGGKVLNPLTATQEDNGTSILDVTN